MLRRPMMYVAAAFAAAVFIVDKGSWFQGLFCICFASLLLKFKLVNSEKMRSFLIITLISFSAGMVTLALWGLSPDPLKDFASNQEKGDVVSVCGRVCTEKVVLNSDGEKYLRLVIKPDMLQNQKLETSRKLLVNCYQGCYDSSRGDDLELVEENAMPGMEVEIRGQVKLPREKRNPGTFDYAQYLRSQDITTRVTANRIYFISGDEPSYYDRLRMAVFKWKRMFIQGIEVRSGKERASFMNAVMFGDKGQLDQDMLAEFQRNGTAHILAVSGLHIGMIYAFIIKLWSMGVWMIIHLADLLGIKCQASKKGWGLFLFTGIFFGAYIIMADFAPSVIRAVLMVMLHSLSVLKCRRYDLQSAAFLVILLMLIKNPYMIFNVGFQMSFLAVLSMTLVLPYVRSFYKGIFLASLAVQIGLGPFLLYNFNYLSLLAVFINVPVVAITGLLVPAGLCSMILCSLNTAASWIPGIGAAQYIMDRIVAYLCLLLQGINSYFDEEGITTFLVGSPRLVWLIIYYMILLVLASEEGRLRILKVGFDCEDMIERYILRVRSIISTFVIICLIAFAVEAFYGDGFQKTDVVFLDVGQGDSIHIKTAAGIFDERNYLIDGGGSTDYQVGTKTIKPYLLKAGITHLDGAFATHLHTDHYMGLCELAREGMIDKLYIYEGNRARIDEVQEETGLEKEKIIFLKAGQQVYLGKERCSLLQNLIGRIGGMDKSVVLDVLWPEGKTDSEYERLIADESDENDMSLVMKVSFGGEDGVSVMTTGDMDDRGEAAVIDTYSGKAKWRRESQLDADILKVAHHGSKYSSSDEFLDKVSAGFAVIQVGENNNYGHPSQEVLQKLAERQTKVYRTDLMGAVGFEIKGKGVRAKVSVK